MGEGLAMCFVCCICWSLVWVYHNGFQFPSIVILYFLLVKKVELGELNVFQI